MVGGGALAFAAYGSLLPFDFVSVPFADAWRAFAAILATPPARRPSRTDILANLLLFVPVGFFFAGSLLAGTSRTVARTVSAALAVLLVSVGASALIEFLQIFTPARVPSRVDVAAQTAGCTAGILLWVLGGDWMTRWIQDSARAAPADRVGRLLLAYAAGWTVVNLAPFDLTVDIADLGRRVHSGKIVVLPFTEPGLLTIGWWWDALAETLAAIPLGLLAGTVAKNRPGGSVMLPAGAVLGLVFSTEVAQVFIRSHAARGTDWLLATCGIMLGLAVVRRYSEVPIGLHAPGLHLRALVLLMLWIAVLCAYHWNPFTFALDPEAIADKLSRLSLIPFAGYRTGSYLNTFNNLLTKVSLSLPLGIFAGLALRAFPIGHASRATVSIVVFAVIFGVLELGQLFVAARMPDPTDVMVGACSAMAGLYLAGWLASPGSHGLS